MSDNKHAGGNPSTEAIAGKYARLYLQDVIDGAEYPSGVELRVKQIGRASCRERV